MFHVLFRTFATANALQNYSFMTEILLSSTLIIAIAMAFLCVKLIFRKNGSFSSQHIHDSEPMRQRGIHCVIDQDREMRMANPSAVRETSKS